MDIVHQPSVIFLDEPTSGLDSVTTLGLCEALKAIAADGGKTVIMTIHQPSTKVFNLFDKVLFLSAGRITFLGKSRELMPFTSKFINKHGIRLLGTSEEDMGSVLNGNPPEVFLELCDQLVAEDRLNLLVDETASSLGLTQNTQDEHRQSQGNRLTLTRLSLFGGEEGKNMSSLYYVEYANELIPEIRILIRRATLNFLRTPEVFQARIGASVIFGTLVGTLFYNTQNNALGVSNRASYFIFTIANFNYTSLDALQIILSEREIFQREFSR